MSSSPHRVLVAESDEIVLALVSHILHRQGYSIDVAVSADEAERQLRTNHYSAVLIDSKFAGVLSKFPASMPDTILLSPQTESDLPVHAVLQKPLEFGLLVDTVADCVK